MNLKNSLTGRLVIGKTVGFLIGGIAFFVAPHFFPEMTLWLRWAIWAWYTTMGAFVGLLGVMDHHPVWKFRMPFWFRGVVIGAWMNFVLVLFIYPDLVVILQDFAFQNPFWLVLEGAIVGFIVDGLATKYAGEGSRIV